MRIFGNYTSTKDPLSIMLSELPARAAPTKLSVLPSRASVRSESAEPSCT